VNATYLYFGNLGPFEKQYQIPHFIGLALQPNHKREMRHNALDPLPFETASIAKIQSQDVFEHLPFDKVPAVLDEIHRVLAVGGVFRLSLPDYRSPPLKKRTIYDSGGRPVGDLMMGACAKYDRQTASAKIEFADDGDSHLWFPRYESVLELIVKSTIRQCASIRFYQYFSDDDNYVCEPIPENEMFVMRSVPHDNRADGKPISIVVDFVK